jgi:hypothetical protein
MILSMFVQFMTFLRVSKMAVRWQDLRDDVQVQMMRLFAGENFCFATSEQGRSPTFYFAKGGPQALSTANLSGRIRTMHPHGPLIAIKTGVQKHLFFQNSDKREQFIHVLDNVRHRLPEIGGSFCEIVQTCFGALPQQGAYHFEYTLKPNRQVDITHKSGGTVVTGLRLNRDKIHKLIDRVLVEGGAVKIDRQEVVRVDDSVNRVQAVTDPSAYLQGLN